MLESDFSLSSDFHWLYRRIALDKHHPNAAGKKPRVKGMGYKGYGKLANPRTSILAFVWFGL